MRVFVTGATGFIGSNVVRELLAAGHEVLGLARSDAKAEALAATGAEVSRVPLDDLGGLQKVAAGADGVIHLAFNHDFSKFVENCENDRRVITALGAALAGSSRPLVATSGLAVQAAPGKPAMEDDPPVDPGVVPRAASEQATAAVAESGVNASLVRLPQVHDPVRQGLITLMIQLYREKGVCAYIGDGRNRIPAVHVSDAARLYRLALEKAEPGARYHAVGETGVPLKAIAETIARPLQLPVKSITPREAESFFGWFARIIGNDGPASNIKTREKLGWKPAGPGLLADLEQGRYFEAAS